MVRAVGWPSTSQFLDFTCRMQSIELFTMPSYFTRCSSSRVLIFRIAP